MTRSRTRFPFDSDGPRITSGTRGRLVRGSSRGRQRDARRAGKPLSDVNTSTVFAGSPAERSASTTCATPSSTASSDSAAADLVLDRVHLLEQERDRLRIARGVEMSTSSKDRGRGSGSSLNAP